MNSSQFWDLFEAYKQVHNGVEEVSESSEEMAMLRRNMQDALRRGDGEAIKRISSQLADLQPQAQARIGATQRGLDKVKRGRPRTQSESYDLYDLVLEYLLDEGLCESVENAEIMRAHMSEGWVDAIVESYEKIEEDADTVAHYNQLIKNRSNLNKFIK